MRKSKAKPFIWSGWIKPTNQTVVEDVTIFRGNFVMELKLPNALRLDKFDKLKFRLSDYWRTHQGKNPSYIRVNRRQLDEYKVLLTRSVMPQITTSQWNLTFNGIPLIWK